jgi:uncharacterized protein YkwD
MQNPTSELLRRIRMSALALALILPVGCSNHESPTGPSTLSNTPAPPAPAPSSGPSDSEIQSLVDMVNNHRRSIGLSPLVWDDRVAEVALAHSQDMVDRNYYSHINPEGQNAGARLREAGIDYTWWAENYCYGFSTASAAFNFWINSPAHKSNIESSNVTHHGVGKVGSVWTHNFIKPRTVTSVELSSAASTSTP